MSAILGIGINSLNKLEQGLLPPRLSLKALLRINDYFGISLRFQVSIKLEDDIYFKEFISPNPIALKVQRIQRGA